MKPVQSLSLLTAAIAISATSHAGLISYEVTNFNKGKGTHTLTTFDDVPGDKRFSSRGDLYFVLDNGDTSGVADDIGRLQGTLYSAGGRTAQLDLLFTGAMSELDFDEFRYKKEGGRGYKKLLKRSPLFFRELIGSITIGDKIYDIDSNVVMGGRSFTGQFGFGANAKHKKELGFSSWIRSCQREEGVAGAAACMDSDHWDLNFALNAIETTPVSVPEPGVLSLLAAGVAGLFTKRRS